MAESSANAPADGGLSSLGLLMQLGGSMLAAYTTLLAFVVLAAPDLPGVESFWIFTLLGLSVVRSAFHRAAGTELLYRSHARSATSPLNGVYRYIAIALVHTAIVLLVFKLKFHLPGRLLLGVGLGLVVWPLVLLGTLSGARFRGFKTELPLGEDKGFEGAAILMTVLGTCGFLTAVGMLVALVDGGHASGAGVIVVALLLGLCVRSALHVHAGVSGLRETKLDHAADLANRYANFGLFSGLAAGGLALLAVLLSGANLVGLAGTIVTIWLLVSWPMIVRRFFGDRQFADLLAGDRAAHHHRAPDGGLTGLGWLLLALAAFQASFLIPQLVSSEWMAFDNAKLQQLLVPTGEAMHSLWWSAGLVMLQAWAALELVRMTPARRVVGNLFGVVAIGANIFLAWPIDTADVTRLLPLVVALVIPGLTLVLVNRQLAPTARARFRAAA